MVLGKVGNSKDIVPRDRDIVAKDVLYWFEDRTPCSAKTLVRLD